MQQGLHGRHPEPQVCLVRAQPGERLRAHAQGGARGRAQACGRRRRRHRRSHRGASGGRAWPQCDPLREGGAPGRPAGHRLRAATQGGDASRRGRRRARREGRRRRAAPGCYGRPGRPARRGLRGRDRGHGRHQREHPRARCGRRQRRELVGRARRQVRGSGPRGRHRRWPRGLRVRRVPGRARLQGLRGGDARQDCGGGEHHGAAHPHGELRAPWRGAAPQHQAREHRRDGHRLRGRRRRGPAHRLRLGGDGCGRPSGGLPGR